MDLKDKFYDLCTLVVMNSGFSLYDMEYIPSSNLLRVYIFDSNTGNALLKDCVQIDRAFTPYFEQEEWIPEGLTLEVSSPGVFRSLKRKEHFHMAKDQMIKVHPFKTVENICENAPLELHGKRVIRAKLLDVFEDGILLSFGENLLRLKYNGIKKAILDPDSI